MVDAADNDGDRRPYQLHRACTARLAIRSVELGATATPLGDVTERLGEQGALICSGVWLAMRVGACEQARLRTIG